MPDPEALARIDIDAQLQQAGWIVQDRANMSILAGPGVAIREVSIPGASEADYLLIAGSKAIGILEAKSAGTTLKGVETQTWRYAQSLPDHIPSWTLPLPMLYESTGKETQFANLFDPEPRMRRLIFLRSPREPRDIRGGKSRKDANWPRGSRRGPRSFFPDRSQRFLAGTP